MSILGWVTIALFVLIALVFVVLWPWPSATQGKPVVHALNNWHWDDTADGFTRHEGLRCTCGWLTLGNRAQTLHNGEEHLRLVEELAGRNERHTRGAVL